MARKASTFLMFEGAAEEALHLYTSIFENSSIVRLERYGADEDGTEDSVKQAELDLSGHSLLFFDSYMKHEFTFTPSVSIFVRCESEAELDSAFTQLSESGEVLMPLAHYEFGKKFGWTNDRFGVSWQLSLD